MRTRKPQEWWLNATMHAYPTKEQAENSHANDIYFPIHTTHVREVLPTDELEAVRKERDELSGEVYTYRHFASIKKHLESTLENVFGERNALKKERDELRAALSVANVERDELRKDSERDKAMLENWHCASKSTNAELTSLREATKGRRVEGWVAQYIGGTDMVFTCRKIAGQRATLIVHDDKEAK